jgi:hypothetical protein
VKAEHLSGHREVAAFLKCGRCQCVKEAGEFTRNVTRVSGLHTRCRECSKETKVEGKMRAVAREVQRRMGEDKAREDRWMWLRRLETVHGKSVPVKCSKCQEWKGIVHNFSREAWKTGYTCYGCCRLCVEST